MQRPIGGKQCVG